MKVVLSDGAIESLTDAPRNVQRALVVSWHALLASMNSYSVRKINIMRGLDH
jgi:hypothetical protein